MGALGAEGPSRAAKTGAGDFCPSRASTPAPAGPAGSRVGASCPEVESSRLAPPPPPRAAPSPGSDPASSHLRPGRQRLLRPGKKLGGWSPGRVAHGTQAAVALDSGSAPAALDKSPRPRGRPGRLDSPGAQIARDQVRLRPTLPPGWRVFVWGVSRLRGPQVKALPAPPPQAAGPRPRAATDQKISDAAAGPTRAPQS